MVAGLHFVAFARLRGGGFNSAACWRKPTMQLYALAPQESSKQEHVPDFQGHRLLLLAHADGYWYLVDKDDAALLVIPDQDDKFIKLQLKQESKPSDRTPLNQWNFF
jgi:hypothetical protein